MSLLYHTYNAVIQVLLVLFVIFYSLRFAKNKNLNLNNVFFLVILHLIITLVSCVTTQGTHSDPPMYYDIAENSPTWFELFGVSSTFIRFLIYPLINYLQFSYLTIFIIFSGFSIYGFLLLYEMLNNFKPIRVLYVNIKYIILFLPMYHIWMSFLGKDGLTFMFTMILLKQITSEKIKLKRTIIPLLFLAFIRPYLLVFILVALVLVFMTLKLNTVKRLLLFFAILLSGLIVSYQIFSLLNIDIETYFSSRLERVSYYSNYKKEGSFIDPKTLNTFEKVFAYLFRPLFYDAKGVLQIYTSLENLFFLLVFIKFIFIFSLKELKKEFIPRLLLFYCLIFLLINSYLIYNLGLVNRQKYIIFPAFLFLLGYFNNYRFSADKIKR